MYDPDQDRDYAEEDYNRRYCDHCGTTHNDENEAAEMHAEDAYMARMRLAESMR